MDRPIDITIIGDSRKSVEELITVIKKSLATVHICSFQSESDFIGNQPSAATDLIFSIISSAKSDWKIILEMLKEIDHPPFVVYLLPEQVDKVLSMEMINAGAYDVIQQNSFNELPVLLQRIVRDIGHYEFLGFLSLEKKFTDHILDHSRSMLTIINKDYTYEKANNKFCSALNVDKDLIVGKTLTEIWGKENFDLNIRKKIDTCFSGETVRYEALFQTPAYGKRYFEVSFRPLITGSDQITHLLAETFDVTDIKLTQQAFDDIEKDFKKFETNIPIGYLRCNTDGKILHVNRAFMRILELADEGEIISVNLDKLYADEGLFRIHLEQILFYKSKTFSRVLLKTGKGKEIPCRMTAFHMPAENDKESYIDLSFEDSSRELILETRLLQAQKLETIGSLAGGIAHDFNNILATIYGYAELILSDLPEDSPATDKIGKIINSVARARSLTNQILTFSRQVEQEKICVSIWKVLKETIDFFKAGVAGHVKVIDSVKKTDALVFADPTQLFRVFLNLMTNSIQAMEGQYGKLKIELSIVIGELIKNELNKDIVADEYALITITDTGVGMDQTLVNRIFEPFFTTREVGKGTGLGLSVVHGIISEIEGEILVSSKKDVGTTFYVYIPVTKCSSEDRKVDIETKHLLFVSGNRHESRILSLALESSGYKLNFVPDQGKLLKILKDEKQITDLIIYMDDIPDFTKENLINLLLTDNLNTPVLLITDYEHCFIDEKFVNSGIIKQQLIKPVSLKEVRNAIHLSIKY